MSTLLVAQSLTFNAYERVLLKDVSFTVEAGDRIGLLGHNGSGKSSLLRLLDGSMDPTQGSVAKAKSCLLSRVEQFLPSHLEDVSAINSLEEMLPPHERYSSGWKAELLMSQAGFREDEYHTSCRHLSGGQHNRLLLARALINEPDLLLLDEPGNHLDLPTMLWLEQFLSAWKGSLIMVSHDAALLDAVTKSSWILRDSKLHHFTLPCSKARQALAQRDRQDEQRFENEQREIERVTASAKRLAQWGKTYDNEDLARKAKTMERRVEHLLEDQTEITEGSPWTLSLKGDGIKADRLLSMESLEVAPSPSAPVLFNVFDLRLKSADCIALAGRNGCGKSTLLSMIWHHYREQETSGAITFNPRLKVGYYDQALKQLNDDADLSEALEPFEPDLQVRRQMLIKAGFGWVRHQQKVAKLSGGERARLLFAGLSLARYSLLLLDEPTNHLDMEGKEALAQSLIDFEGGILLVSHDRNLIEMCCNRIWLVDQHEMIEVDSLDAVTASFDHEVINDDQESVLADGFDHAVDDDARLSRLIELETLLNNDLARKPKHQKPERQAQWRAEIEGIYAMIS